MPHAEGARVWHFPDAYLPTPRGDGPYYSHEAICVLNTARRDAHITLTFYFEDRPPMRASGIVVGGERTRHIRLDRPEELGGVSLPCNTPYAIRLVADVPVIVQYSRLDTTQMNMALMTVMGYATKGHAIDEATPTAH